MEQIQESFINGQYGQFVEQVYEMGACNYVDELNREIEHEVISAYNAFYMLKIFIKLS